MTEGKSAIVLLELSAILAGNTRDWTLLNEGGDCCVPEVVLNELDFLTRKGIFDDEEKIAREFMRFFPDSRWQTIYDISPHPLLKEKEGANISKKSRLLLTVAQCVYGLSLNNPNRQIILVTNEGNLKNDVSKINQENIKILTVAQYRKWIREKEMPPSTQDDSSTDNQNQSRLRRRKKRRGNNGIENIRAILLIVTILGVTGLSTWYLIEPKSLQTFINDLGLPFNIIPDQSQN